MGLVYKPDHPEANENGMIDRSMLYYDKTGAPYVISDTIEPIRHMADNKMYTSKAKFREATKAHGCIEVGNETNHMLKPRQPIQLSRRKRRDDIKRALYELRNGMVRRP